MLVEDPHANAEEKRELLSEILPEAPVMPVPEIKP